MILKLFLKKPLSPELAQVFSNYSSKQNHVFEFQIDFSETEIEKMKERRTNTWRTMG